jgi:hypothetical protein
MERAIFRSMLEQVAAKEQRAERKRERVLL